MSLRSVLYLKGRPEDSRRDSERSGLEKCSSMRHLEKVETGWKNKKNFKNKTGFFRKKSENEKRSENKYKSQK